MPIEICNALGPNCILDWDGISAIATAAATAAALMIPPWQRSRDRRERESALAYSLLLKMVKIHSDILKLREHVLEQRALAKEHGAKPDSWSFFRPLASLPTDVRFSSDELALLFSAKDNDTFNAVISMDEVHASDLANMKVYGERREALTQLLPGAEMDGLVGGVDLTAQQHARIAPFSAQLDALVADIVKAIEQHAKDSEAALRDLHRVINMHFKMKIGLSLPSE